MLSEKQALFRLFLTVIMFRIVRKLYAAIHITESQAQKKRSHHFDGSVRVVK